jgi:hypothetical protein
MQLVDVLLLQGESGRMQHVDWHSGVNRLPFLHRIESVL